MQDETEHWVTVGGSEVFTLYIDATTHATAAATIDATAAATAAASDASDAAATTC